MVSTVCHNLAIHPISTVTNDSPGNATQYFSISKNIPILSQVAPVYGSLGVFLSIEPNGNIKKYSKMFKKLV